MNPPKKLDSQGNFQYFPGSTIISPVRQPASAPGLEQSSDFVQSQTTWANTLKAAAHLVKTSSIGKYWAVLPDDSFHMTWIGLTTEFVGPKPNDMRNALPEEIEAEMILRTRNLLSIEQLQSLIQAEFEFDKIAFSSVIFVYLKPKNQALSLEIEEWRRKVADATKLPIRNFMPFHISLAYRKDDGNTSMNPKYDKNAEKQLEKQIEMLFNKIPDLISNPPSLTFFPDMTEFPTSPLYKINAPLQLILDQNYGAALCRTPSKRPPNAPVPKIHQKACVIAVLGRKLEKGQITKNLENRLAKAYDLYAECLETKKYEILKIMFCGGKTEADSEISEAEAMQQWIESKFSAIRKEDILLEDISTTTVENALCIRRKLLFEQGFANLDLKIVTTKSHLARSAFIFNAIISRENSIVNMDFISCDDADINDAPIELARFGHNMLNSFIFSLSHSTTWRHSDLVEMIKKGRLNDLKESYNNFKKVNPPANGQNWMEYYSNDKSINALQAACSTKYLSICKYLLSIGAEVDWKNMYGKTALSYAVSSGNMDSMMLLLQHGSDVSVLSDQSENVPGYLDLNQPSTLPLSIPTKIAICMFGKPVKRRMFIFNLPTSSSALSTAMTSLCNDIIKYQLKIYGNTTIYLQNGEDKSAATTLFSAPPVNHDEQAQSSEKSRKLPELSKSSLLVNANFVSWKQFDSESELSKSICHLLKHQKSVSFVDFQTETDNIVVFSNFQTTSTIMKALKSDSMEHQDRFGMKTFCF